MDANPASADLYERLGISQDAKPEEIRAAFKAMRKELHPDSRPESLRGHFNAMMSNINEANQTLSDPRSRAKYDARRSYRAQTQDAEQKAAREQAERQRQEEARRRQQEADQRRREEEARQRQHREEERRRQEEEAQQGDEDEPDWWEYVDEFGDDDPRRREAPEEEPAPPAASNAGTILDKLPGPVHRLAIYTAGSWFWLVVAAMVWNLPFWGAEFVAFLACLFVWGISCAVLALTWKAAVVVEPVQRVVGFFMPSQGYFTAYWYARRVIESAVLAPVMVFVGAAFSALYWPLSLAAFAYVVLWGVEFFRWRARRQEVGG